MKKLRPFLRPSAALIYAALLVLFYIRYVPFLPGFQSVFLPLLVGTYLLTALDVRRGLLLFIVLFPLVNNLPYFFGIHEPFPPVPAALILFLFFFGGWLIRKAAEAFGAGSGTSPLQRPLPPIVVPVAVFAALAGLSSLLAFLRYANFWPFGADAIYDLRTNAFGVTAGGAIMSVVFIGLNYLGAPALFYILLRTVDSREFLRKVLAALGAATGLALLFGLYQHFGDITLGNNPTSLIEGGINATFKDALAFGAYIALIVPMALGIAAAAKGKIRFAARAVAGVSAYLIFATASKTAFLCLVAGLVFYGLLSLPSIRTWLGDKRRKTRRRFAVGAAGLAVLLALGLVIARAPITSRITQSRTVARIITKINQGNLRLWLGGRGDTLWKMAVLMMKDYPLSGTGAGSFIIESSNFAALTRTDIGTPESAENYYLQVGAEMGWAGLCLIAAIFGLMVRQIFRGLKRIPRSDPWRPVFLGAAASVSAFFLGLVFHTYAGAHEIHYAFWLAAALLFLIERLPSSPSASGDPRAEMEVRRKRPWILGMTLTVLSGLALFLASTHSLSLESRTRQFGWVQSFGFYPAEKRPEGGEFQWTKRTAALPVPAGTASAGAAEVVIPLHASHPDIRQKPVLVSVFAVEGFFHGRTLLARVTLGDSLWKDAVVPVPASLEKTGYLLVEVDRTWNPRKASGTADPRDLGVAVGPVRRIDRPPANQ